MNDDSKRPALVLDVSTPTLFVDFDGTLHRGRGLLNARKQVSLDTGAPPFEFAPILTGLLAPYPQVEIVLTTSWLDVLSAEEVVSFLPPELAIRVVGTTQGIKPRFGELLNGSARTYIIRSYVFEHRLKNWLAVDDTVYGAHHLSMDFLDLEPHLVLLDSARGLGDEDAQRRVRNWLLSLDA